MDCGDTNRCRRKEEYEPMKRHLALTSIGVAAMAAGLAAVLAAELSPGSAALTEANGRMHHAMNIEMTGDVDTDFVRSMIPHHEGAVEMARIVLEYGKDPEIRKLAEGIVKAQESEIAFMNGWLAEHASGNSGEMDHSQH